MSIWRQFVYGWRALRDRETRDKNVSDEVTNYYEEAEAELRERGMTAEEARRVVRARDGSPAAAAERAGEYGWEIRFKSMMDDLRFAMRQLRKHPVFTVTAVLTMALGIGANTAVFTVVERVLLAPLPYRDAGRLVAMETRTSENGRTGLRVTGPDGADIREQARTLEALSLYNSESLGVQLRDHAAYVIVAWTDAQFGRVFGLKPVAGRLYSDADADHAAVVSERFARDNFGSPRSAVGKVMHVEGHPVEITGVLARGFNFPVGAQVWMGTAGQPALESRTAYNDQAVALMRRGVSLEQARAEMAAISARLRTAYPADNAGKDVLIEPLREALTGDARSTLVFLWIAAGLILLIACVNVTHMELVHSIERQRELAIRRALGSSRWRVMQPVFMESLLLALTGGAAGVALAFPALRILIAMAPKDLPRSGEIHLDLVVLLFTLALSMGTAVMAAMLPAARAAKVDAAEALKSDATRGTTRRSVSLLRDGLVIAEVAATFVLAVGAGLLLRTMMNLKTREPGYEIRQMLVIDADAPAQNSEEASRAVGSFNQIFARLRQLPGVERVGGVMGLPTGEYGSNGYYETRGGMAADAKHPPSSTFSVASPGYFGTLSIPLIRGRDFSAADTRDSRMVAVISEALAKQSFGDADPIGKEIRCGLDSDAWMTIVGVVGDVRQASPAEDAGPILYMPMTQHPLHGHQIHIVLRTEVNPLTLMKAADAVIAQSDPLIARRYTTLDAMLGDSIATERFRAVLITAFAGVGLLLAMLGVYGTVAYSVAQRRVEFGVRMAFGAQRGDVLSSILSRVSRTAVTGIVLGLGISLAVARFMESLLVGVRPTDPASLAAVAALLLLTALTAASGPGWKAARTDPMTTLRNN